MSTHRLTSSAICPVVSITGTGLGKVYCLWSVSQRVCPVPTAFLVGHLRRQRKAPILGLCITTLTSQVRVSAPWLHFCVTPYRPALALELGKLVMKEPSQQPSCPTQAVLAEAALSIHRTLAWEPQAWMQPYCPALQIISHPRRANCGDSRGHTGQDSLTHVDKGITQPMAT